MRHLYATSPKNELVLEHAKQFERRRCNHQNLEEPMSELDCLSSVVDPRGSRTNKHRYVVASQDSNIRSYMRSVPGVPLIYLKRSVMIMEPMAGATEEVRDREEQTKFQAGLRRRRSAAEDLKRKRVEDGEEDRESRSVGSARELIANDVVSVEEPAKRFKKRGPSAPNPLSMKKPKKRAQPEMQGRVAEEDSDKKRKRQRRSRHAVTDTAPKSTALTYSETRT